MRLRSEFGLAESRVLLYLKFVRVPVKMRKVIRASRERCLTLEVLGRMPVARLGKYTRR